MPQKTIEILNEEYKTALDWATKLVGKIPEENRFHKYRIMIQRQTDEHKSGPEIRNTNRAKMKEDAEALLEASTLIDIHKKFNDNSNKYFIDKLENIFGGEYYASDEPVGTDSFARNTQAELVIATKCSDPSKLSFWGNDIVYSFENFKFGIEVKRLNSDLVNNTFEKACDQIQNKRNDVSFGVVALCMDRFLFFNNRSGLILPKPILLPRASWMVAVATTEDLIASNKQQLIFFHKEYELGLREIAKKYPKVAGYIVYIYHPVMVGMPVQLVSSGYSEYMLWESNEMPERKLAFGRFMEEQFYSDSLTVNLDKALPWPIE